MSRDSMKLSGLKKRNKIEKAVGSRKTGISAADIATKTSIKPATVRLHLLALKKSGIVSATRTGRSVLYVKAPPAT